MMFEQSKALPEEDIESIEGGNLRKRARHNLNHRERDITLTIRLRWPIGVTATFGNIDATILILNAARGNICIGSSRPLQKFTATFRSSGDFKNPRQLLVKCHDNN